MLNQLLVEWSADREMFLAEGIEPPSLETIDRAAGYARRLQHAAIAPPTRLVPDTHGGIVFERCDGPALETLRVLPGDEGVEYCQFVDSQLVQRTVI